jgi:hypothetical protein
VSLRFRDATAKDVAAIAALQNAVAGALTARHGEGPWSSPTSERSVELSLRHARVRLGVSAKRAMSVLRLATKKPWAIDVAYFTPVKRSRDVLRTVCIRGARPRRLQGQSAHLLRAAARLDAAQRADVVLGLKRSASCSVPVHGRSHTVPFHAWARYALTAAIWVGVYWLL